MKLWILKPIETGEADWPWHPWFDKCFGMVVRADSQEEARLMAAKANSEEGYAAWMDPKLSSCSRLMPRGAPGVILQDVKNS